MCSISSSVASESFVSMEVFAVELCCDAVSEFRVGVRRRLV